MASDRAENPRAPKTYDALVAFWRGIMESAADKAESVFGDRPQVMQDGGKFWLLWADGEITNEYEVERIQ